MLVYSAWKQKRRGNFSRQFSRIESLEQRMLLTGGLTGVYYDNQDFTGANFIRVDPTINFNWGTGSPMSGISPDSFSVRWSGQVQAQKTEPYTFYVRSDDGAKLTVNGQVLVNKMVAQSATEWSGTISLVAGQWYDLHLDYFDRAGGASAQLSWSSPSTPKQIIPSTQLDPNPRVIQQPPPPPPPTGTQKPFKGAAFNVGDRIDAEDYDIGGEGISYHDVDAANRGGKYRSDGVDIETSSAGGFDVAYANAGEWLEYTINVPSDGNYELDIATASYAFGGTFHIDVDGVAALGPITVPATGGWQKWQVLHAAGLKLTAGTHVMRLSMDTRSFANVDYMKITPAPAPGVDLMIRNHRETNYTGDNVYSADGGVQLRSQSTNFYPATYELRVENDGTAADSFIVQSNFNPGPGWRVSYYLVYPDGSKPDPISLEGAGWNTGVLNPGEFKRINVDVSPSPKAGGGATRTIDITAASASNPGNTDQVRSVTTLSTVRLPEIRRRNTANDNTYLLEVQNKGNSADSLRVTGPAGGTGFTLKYFDDYEAGNDITAAVTSSGWVTPKLAPNKEQDIRVQIVPSSSDVHTFTITATSVGDGSKRDTVTISDRMPAVKQPPFFVIGAWSQPTSLFSRWKGRGINTLMHFEPEGGRVSIDQWTAAANAAGLYMIRAPRANPADDLKETRLLAWMHRDEPDIHAAKASDLQADYDKWHAVNPNMPVLINFAGSDVLDWNGGTSEATYKTYMQATDWVSNSIYPVTGWYRPDDLDIPGRALDKLEKWSDGRPQFAIIESGPQNLSWMPKDTPGPNAGQFRFEMWDAVIRGAKGIVYFPFSFTPSFHFDNTPPEIDAEMRKQHPRLLEIGSALLSQMDPPSMGMRLPDGLEGTWRNYNGKKYFIVLNATDQPLSNQVIKLRGIGAASSATVASESRTTTISNSAISDSFGPYEAHVYIV